LLIDISEEGLCGRVTKVTAYAFEKDVGDLNIDIWQIRTCYVHE
jgi:hypothetical protein